MTKRCTTAGIAWLLMAAAFAATMAYTNTEQEPARRYAAPIFGSSLGSALLLLGKRVTPAIFMLGAALWMVVFEAD